MSGKRSSDAANREVVDVVGDISKKMDDFLASVAALRDLEEKPQRIQDEVALAEREKDARTEEFDKNMLDHELMTIQNVLQKQNKVSIDIDELNDLRALQRREDKDERVAKKARFDEEVESKVKIELDLKKLHYEKKVAEATAREASFSTERDILQNTIVALREEINSQKDLTSQLALSSCRN